MMKKGTPIKFRTLAGEWLPGYYVRPYDARGSFDDEHIIRYSGALMVVFGTEIKEA